MDYGIQLYSVRDLASKDLEAALKAVSEIGYKYVEFAGFFGHDAQTVRGWLDKYGLICCAAHCSWQEMRDDFEKTVQYHKIIGNKNFVSMASPDELWEFVDFCREFQPKLAAEGISVHYHNHAFEFDLQEDGLMLYPVIECCTDIRLETDTYWLYVGKTNPTAVMDRLHDRIDMIHIKDGDTSGHGKPLGRGTAPVAEVFAKAKEYGMLIIVESETCNPSGIEEAKICFDYLKSLE